MAMSRNRTFSSEAEAPRQRSHESGERPHTREHSERSARKSFYYPALDTLRIFAMLAILVYHYAPHRMSGGFIGVDVFLVVSGFLLTRTVLGWRNNFTTKYPNFLVRRVIRLGIPMLSVMILAIALINAFFSSLLYNMRASFLSSMLFVNNWWQIKQGASYFEAYAHPQVFTHLWYVAVIMQISILWPLILRFLQRLLHNRYIVALACLVLALISAVLMAALYHTGADPSRVYYGTDTRLYAFALGGALGAMWSPNKMRERFGRASGLYADVVALLGLAGLTFFALHLKDQSMWTYRGGLFVAAIVATLTVAALTVSGGPLNRLLSLRPLTFLGKITFSVYLWYYPVLTIGNSNMFLATHLWIQWVALLVLGVLTYIFVEVVLVRQFVHGHRLTFPRPSGFISFVRGGVPNIIAAVLIVLVALSSVSGLVRAQKVDNQTVEEMQKQIEENERMLKAKQAAENRHAKDDVADISYLDRATMLYCRDLKVTFVGDSILLAAAAPLSEVFPQAVIDGEVGRSLSYSGSVIDQLKADGKLSDIVVLVLGTNGPFTEEELDSLIKQLDGKQVFIVNTLVPRPWQNDVNEKLGAYANKSKKDKVTLIDWKSTLENHPEWLYEDNVHPNEEGAENFAKLIAETLYDVLASDEQKEMDRIADETIAAEGTDSGDNSETLSDSIE